MRLKLSDNPEEITTKYKLSEIATEDGYVYCETQKGMYGSPPVGIITQDLLQDCLLKVGYHQSKILPGLWTHEMRKTYFTLVNDNFAIKFKSMEHAHHLIKALKQDYTIKRLGCKKIHQAYPQIGLQEPKGLCPYARIQIKGISLIQASNAKNKTELIASTCKTPIRSQSTICN
jgi:hypothetical protein